MAFEEIDIECGVKEDAAMPPSWFDESKITIRYDACPVIEAGQSPMQEILKLSSQLKQNEILQVTTPFKPIPIIDLLKSKGFIGWSRTDDNFFIKE